MVERTSPERPAAHEEGLRQALVPVAEAFKRWKLKELGSGELSEIIHCASTSRVSM